MNLLHPQSRKKAPDWQIFGKILAGGCGEIQIMSHIINSCPLTNFDGCLLRLHEADEAAVDWLTTWLLAHDNNNNNNNNLTIIIGSKIGDLNIRLEKLTV